MRSLMLCSALAALGASAYAAGPIPRPAQQLEIVDAGGKDLLSSYKGKVVVVQFLLTTCSHCQAFSGLLGKLETEYAPRGFQALGAGVNEVTPDVAKNYFVQYAKTFPVGPFNDRDALNLFLGLSVMDQPGFPQIVVIDRKGQIREQSTSNYNDPQPLQDEAHIRSLIETLLKEGAGNSGAAVKARAPASAVTAAAKKP